MCPSSLRADLGWPRTEWVLETQHALRDVSGSIEVFQPLQSQPESGDAASCFGHRELESGAHVVLSGSPLQCSSPLLLLGLALTLRQSRLVQELILRKASPRKQVNAFLTDQ